MKILETNYHVQYVFHLSDIHIRLYHRLDDEYEHVFQQMYKILEKSREQKENCLIVLTGDILHNKNDLSPECIMTTLKFLNTLSSYYPTLLIAGNHDTLLNNLNRMDSLSAILTENHNPHLHYLKYTGFYQYGTILFGVSSLLDNQWAKEFPPDTIKLKRVALYHGGVGRFSTNKGFVMEGIPLNTFDGYEIVMLGDIHLHQYLDKQKRIAYAGSMIAQNFGETDPHHGVLKWDMENNTSSLIILDNPYRYCEATLEEEVLFMDGKREHVQTVLLPEKCRLKLRLSNPKTTKMLEKITYLKNKFPMVQINEEIMLEKETPQANHHEKKNNVFSMIQNYFQTLPETWKDKDKLFEIILTYFKNNIQIKTNSSSHFEILSVEFDYMFGYGANNKIDFSMFQQNQTIGIFGMNSAGKSTLIDIMLFLLYGNITRYKHGLSVPNEVIHFQQTKSSGKIIFKSHNIIYEIQKKMTRTKTKIRVDEKLFKIMSDGTKMDLSEEHRKKTDKFVISQIGTPSQFLFTNIFLQSNEQSFRSMTPKERKEFLFDILELSQLEEHYQENYNVWKENKQLLVKLENELKSFIISMETITQQKKQIQQIQTEKTLLEEKLLHLQQKRRKKISLRKYCPLSSVAEIEHQIQETIRQLKTQEDKSTHLEKEVSMIQEDSHQLWEIIESLYKQQTPIFPITFSKKYSQYQYCPTPEDEKCFRQDVYEKFLSEYHDEDIKEEDIYYLLQEKEKYKLYPETYKTSKDDKTIQDRLEWIQQNSNPCFKNYVKNIKNKKLQLEQELDELESKWHTDWEEWEQIQKEPNTIMMDLEFKKDCGSCKHNQQILHECLLETKKLQERKNNLWKKISKSKENYSQLKEEIGILNLKIEEYEKKIETNRQLKEEEVFLQNVLYNRETKRKLDIIQQKVEDLRKKWKCQNDYREMKKLWENSRKKTHNEKIDVKIQEKKKQLGILETCKETRQQIKTLQTKQIELEQWKTNCQYNQQIEQWIEKKEKEEIQLQQELIQKTEEYLRKQQELEKMEEEFQNKQEKEKEYTRVAKENEFLQHLLQILHRDGLSMYFLEKYLPSMEERINQLIKPFLPSKKLLLRKEQKKESTSILLSIDTLGMETTYLGGMEGFIVDASIKEVLAEVSLQCKSNFFMIDEGISALDRKNMENIDQFFHFLEERHPHVFIISHLKEAQHIVRHSLLIVKEGDYSKIIYT